MVTNEMIPYGGKDYIFNDIDWLRSLPSIFELKTPYKNWSSSVPLFSFFLDMRLEGVWSQYFHTSKADSLVNHIT